MFQHARLGIRAIKNRDLRRRYTIAHQFTNFIDDKARFVDIGITFEGTDRLAITRIGPQILAEALAVILDQRVGGGQDIAVRTVVLLQPNDVVARVIALEIAHIADLGAAKA
jgi:hypothetical protein